MNAVTGFFFFLRAMSHYRALAIKLALTIMLMAAGKNDAEDLTNHSLRFLSTNVLFRPNPLFPLPCRVLLNGAYYAHWMTLKILLCSDEPRKPIGHDAEA